MQQRKKHNKPLQFDKNHTILSKTLGDSQASYDLASHICHEYVETSLEQVLANHLKAGAHIHHLLSSISACEQQRLQYAFDSAKTLPMEIQFSSAKKIIDDFNHIQDTLLLVADQYFEHISVQKTHDISQVQADTGNRSMLHSKLEQKSYQDTIQSSISAWKESKSIAIRNYHLGLTVRTIATFLGEQGDCIKIKMNEDIARIFAIHPSEHATFAVCEGEKIQVRLSIEKIEDGHILLSIGKTFPIYAENRKHLNIQVEEHIPVSIRMGKKRQLHARLHDLSIGGIGINVHGINQAPYNIGDKVECQLTLGTQPVTLQGTVRWTGSNNDEARIGIELQHNTNSQQLIQKEVFRMQRNIINSINQLELPSELQKGLV